MKWIVRIIGGLVAGLGIGLIALFIAIFILLKTLPYRENNDVLAFVFALPIAIIVGVVMFIMTVWLLAKEDAEEDSL